MKKIRVLVVEDSMFFRELLVKKLNKDPDLEVVASARDPFEARDMIVKYKPDVMTLDIEMPKMDGHHLTKLIKSNGKTSFLPVIIFSSMISEDMMRKGRSLGADAQITKPEIGTLVGEIDRLILK